ncbi:uncharacterized protein H6S33_009667 [Morchella sextelata]|uniref:uncharacterized protein n=1 Tax=Morchella sextelata TaxID=1174677 RepID=UPI001D05C002|nr:uncharacterized protein H6S33_009667 [Morchella sextelata]KAH0613287.1 hypothetical protein H6S33_009667 [Morchella sextelata]
MTRSHKANDIPHNHPEAVAAFDEHKIPKYFGKTGFVDMAPNKTKKNGGGKGNWGRDGDEIDITEFNTFKPRRRSNSMGNIENQFVPSKFEVVDEPVYDERVHGARHPGVVDDGAELASTISNTSSVEGEKA